MESAETEKTEESRSLGAKAPRDDKEKATRHFGHLHGDLGHPTDEEEAMVRSGEPEWEKEKRIAEERAGKKPKQVSMAVGGPEWERDREVAEERANRNPEAKPGELSKEARPEDQPISNIQRQPD